MSSLRLNIRLLRDSLSIPWGFRLQGGRDLNQPLAVQRVFFNSPAEGELQRGDVILSINGRDSYQLTHQQALDLIKHSPAQLQLAINRPPPGSVGDVLSPPIENSNGNRFQSLSSSNQPSRIIPIQMAEPTFTSSYDDGPYQQSHSKPPHQPLHVYAVPGPQYQQGFERHRTSYSQPPSTPTPTTPVPPWASQQFAPKRVSRLSKIGGGGFDFGTVYATLPRGASSASHGGRTHTLSQSSYDGPEEQEPDRLATGPIPKVCRLRNLGGGGFDFGSTYGAATLPRRSGGRRLSQPVKMPSAANFGYQPQKTSQNRYGGGGFDFGSDFGHRGYGQTPPGRSHKLDNDVNAGGQYYHDYESPYQPSHEPYTATGLLLEQQRLQEQQEEGEAIRPVWERRKHFQQGPTTVRTPLSKPAPRIPKPRPGPTSYASFGTDYGRPSSKQPASNWRPDNQYKPSHVEATPSASYTPISVQYTQRPAPPSAAPKPSPPAPSYAPAHATPPTWQRQEDQDTGTPSWRTSLKSTGTKPWDSEAAYAAEQQQQQQQPVSSKPPSTAATNQTGDRDWTQSAVLKYISQEESRKNKPLPPAVAPKPQYSPVHGQQPQYSPVHGQQPQYSPAQAHQPHQNFYEEIGASDF